MRSITTSLDFIVRQNRINAKSKAPIIKGGAAGVELAKAAGMQSVPVMEGMAEIDGVMKAKFILGLHPIDQSGLYVIP